MTTPGTPEPTTAPSTAMRTFGHLLVNTAVANITTSYLWWALIFWVYLETRNVLATGLIGGGYMLLVSFSSVFFGTVVDHRRKLTAMRLSSGLTLLAFSIAGAVFLLMPEATLLDIGAPWFWGFAVVILAGAVVEHMRNIALSTTVTILVPDERRANANGLVGTVQGLAFILTSIFSGLSVGLLGMGWTMAIALTAATLLHLLGVRFAEDRVAAAPSSGIAAAIDLRGSIRVVRAAAGLFALIVFSTFNNLIGGVYMALMDPYGLELFSVEVWGLALAFAATGFLLGGAAVARFGLGSNPMRSMLLLVFVMGVLGAFFTIREWWPIYVVGIWLYMCLIPAVEAAEQTVIQRVVPLERQGRVFGFAMAFETAAAPVTAFLIAPLAELVIIPWSRSEGGRDALRPLLGDGEARGIALVFLVAGLVMAVVALLALRTPVYRAISRTYRAAAPAAGEGRTQGGDDDVVVGRVGGPVTGEADGKRAARTQRGWRDVNARPLGLLSAARRARTRPPPSSGAWSGCARTRRAAAARSRSRRPGCEPASPAGSRRRSRSSRGRAGPRPGGRRCCRRCRTADGAVATGWSSGLRRGRRRRAGSRPPHRARPPSGRAAACRRGGATGPPGRPRAQSRAGSR